MRDDAVAQSIVQLYNGAEGVTVLKKSPHDIAKTVSFNVKQVQYSTFKTVLKNLDMKRTVIQRC